MSVEVYHFMVVVEDGIIQEVSEHEAVHKANLGRNKLIKIKKLLEELLEK